MNLWNFTDTLTGRLLSWSWFSIGNGLALRAFQNEFLNALGLQFVTWGTVDALIALVGRWNNAKNRAVPENAQTQKQHTESTKLRRLLWLNTFLDLLYILGGRWLWRKKGTDSAGTPSPKWRGHALGIIIQGSFLLLFDLYHAFKLPRPE